MSFLLLSSEKRTFLNRNYYGSRDVLFGCLGVFEGQGNETGGNETEGIRLIRIISILSNLEIRMDGMITKIEEFAFSRYTFRNSYR